MLEGIVRRFLYHPTQLPEDAPLPPWAGDAGEVWIRAEGGTMIHGLHWRPAPGRPTLVYFHGNAQSVYEWALVSEELAPLDVGLLLIDYPGYGKSGSSPSEGRLYAAGRATLGWVLAQDGVGPQDVIVLGKSLGGPVAAEAVQGREGLLGLILESTFRSIPSVAERLLPMIPADAVLTTERYETETRIPSIHLPLLVVHGTEDDLIPVEEGKALFEMANEPKELYLVEGAGHNDVSLVAGDRYGRRLRRWLDKVSGP